MNSELDTLILLSLYYKVKLYYINKINACVSKVDFDCIYAFNYMNMNVCMTFMEKRSVTFRKRSQYL